MPFQFGTAIPYSRRVKRGRSASGAPASARRLMRRHGEEGQRHRPTRDALIGLALGFLHVVGRVAVVAELGLYAEE